MTPSKPSTRAPLEHKQTGLRESPGRLLCLAVMVLLGSGKQVLAAPQSCSTGAGAATLSVSGRYGPSIHFDVYRNGKRVGRHDTRFAEENGALVVRSTLDLSIKVLFIEAYHYRYEATETWCNDALVRLEAKVNDGGTLSEIRAEPHGDGLLLSAVDGKTEVPHGSFSTNHWHPGVLATTAVINTLTGHLNRVSLVPCTAGTPNGETGNRCVDYTGDLKARVWYAPDGRWRGLAFDGSDGSSIDYRLVPAATGTQQAAATDP